MNNTKKVCYNINIIDLTEVNKIEEFKIEITKTIISLTKNYDQYHIEEFCNYEEIFRTIRLLDNIRTFWNLYDKIIKKNIISVNHDMDDILKESNKVMNGTKLLRIVFVLNDNKYKLKSFTKIESFTKSV